MRNVILFIAMSLDGYIADREGKVDWLEGQGDNGEEQDSYAAFEAGIDTVIMGWNTYHQVVTELSPDKWAYDNLQTYVVTHREHCSTDKIRFVRTDPCSLVKKLREEEGKGIWICGGAEIVRQLMEENLIDRYHISVIPTILGGGVQLFPIREQEIKLRLAKARESNGIMELVYEKRFGAI